MITIVIEKKAIGKKTWIDTLDNWFNMSIVHVRWNPEYYKLQCLFSYIEMCQHNVMFHKLFLLILVKSILPIVKSNHKASNQITLGEVYHTELHFS